MGRKTEQTAFALTVLARGVSIGTLRAEALFEIATVHKCYGAWGETYEIAPQFIFVPAKDYEQYRTAVRERWGDDVDAYAFAMQMRPLFYDWFKAAEHAWNEWR